MELTIINMNPFCMYKGEELGIALGCFAGRKFAETSGDEYISEVMGASFAWLDNQGVEYTDSKYNMTRPTKDQVIDALAKYPALLYHALELNLISYERQDELDQASHETDIGM